MKKTRFTDQQIAFVLQQAEAGTPVPEVCRKIVVSEPTFTSMDGSPVASRIGCDRLWSVANIYPASPVWRAQMGNPLAHASIAGRPQRPR